MADMIELKAHPRPNVGKGAARAVRRQGMVPAVIYGDKKSPEPVSLEYKTVWKQVETGMFLSTVYDIVVDGKKTRVLPKDLQVDPVRDFPIHVDFLRLSKGATITVEVAANFINEEESPGLKRGGVLNVVRHSIEVSCPADAIPDAITVDLTGLDIGDAVHMSEITLPDKVEPAITDRDFTIATIASASAEEVETSEEDEELDGEAVEGTEGEEETKDDESD